MQRKPIHEVSNICVAEASNHTLIRLLFPNRQPADEDESLAITNEECAWIYEDVILPSLDAVRSAQMVHWPVTYAAALQLTENGTRVKHLEIPADSVQQFGDEVISRLPMDGPLGDAYFMIERRGTKGGFPWVFGDPEDRLRILELYCAELEMDLEDENLENWYIDLGLELSLPGHVLQWDRTAHAAILAAATGTLSERQAEAHTRQRRFYVDMSSHFYRLAGFRYQPAEPINGIHYFNVYHTEKSATYTLHKGLFREYKASSLLPGSLDSFIESVDKISGQFHQCLGTNGDVDNSLDGSVRIEVRINMLAAMRGLDGMTRDLYHRFVIAIENDDWW